MVKRIYSSTLAPYIEGLIAAKRACGFSYDQVAYTLERLDRFCTEQGFADTVVTRELAASWAEAVPGESGASMQARMSAMCQLSLHMRSLGMDAYVPSKFSTNERPIAYIPTASEIVAFFEAVDSYEETHSNMRYMPANYAVAFRLMLCCGLRLAECCKLATEDFDALQSTIFVRHSKGDKDRLVYLADDIAGMLQNHLSYLKNALGFSPAWVFPGKNPKTHVSKGALDNKFAQFWAKVPGANEHDKHPTPHSLRHAFVVNRMNTWMQDGIDLGQMMPYLAVYLGHVSSSETFYYYHQVQEAFSIVRQHDKIAPRVIPEVM